MVYLAEHGRWGDNDWLGRAAAGRAGAGDYDGDGKTDPAVYRNGNWFILRSSDGGVTTTGWGGLPQDVPVQADYDGDGKSDIAVYRDGLWFIRRSSDGGQTTVGWGGTLADVPVQADYDGDGKTDIGCIPQWLLVHIAQFGWWGDNDWLGRAAAGRTGAGGL